MLQSGMVTEGTADVWIRGTIVGGERGAGAGCHEGHGNPAYDYRRLGGTWGLRLDTNLFLGRC